MTSQHTLASAHLARNLTARATVDLITLFSDRRMPGTRVQLEELTGERVVPKRSGFGWTFAVPRPHEKLGALERWAAAHPHLKLTRFDIAFDFATVDAGEHMALYKYLRSTIAIRRGPRGAKRSRWANGAYYVDFSGGQRREPARNFAVYLKDDITVRVELRLFRAETTRTYAVASPQELTAIFARDANDLFHTHFAARVIDENKIPPRDRRKADFYRGLLQASPDLEGLYRYTRLEPLNITVAWKGDDDIKSRSHQNPTLSATKRPSTPQAKHGTGSC